MKAEEWNERKRKEGQKFRKETAETNRRDFYFSFFFAFISRPGGGRGRGRTGGEEAFHDFPSTNASKHLVSDRNLWRTMAKNIISSRLQ